MDAPRERILARGYHGADSLPSLSPADLLVNGRLMVMLLRKP